jgi:hypothetical protein
VVESIADYNTKTAVMTRRVGSLVLLFIVMWTRSSGQTSHNVITIEVDDSAVRAVLSNPSYALKKRDSIWNSFEGYRLTLAWHERQSVPPSFEFYESALHDMLSDSPRFTKKNRYLETINRIQEIEKNSGGTISRHISSYLPSDSAFTAYTYLVAFTTPYAFSLSDKLVIDIGSPRWHQNAEYIVNIVIHEIYHIGYEIFTPDTLASAPSDKNSLLQSIFNDIQNEGMATYVAYRALDLIPSDYEDRDYQLLENNGSVDKGFHEINQMIADCDSVPLDTMVERAWNTGVAKDRAFYVAGAWMAGEIERTKGKKFLVGLVGKGSRVFVEEYNGIAGKDRKIRVNSN